MTSRPLPLSAFLGQDQAQLLAAITVADRELQQAERDVEAKREKRDLAVRAALKGGVTRQTIVRAHPKRISRALTYRIEEGA